MLLKHLLDTGLPQTAIAERLGVHRRTICRWMAAGIVDPTVPAAPRARAARSTKLAPYEAIIQERLTTYPQLSAVRLFAECQAAGYPGSYTQLKQFVARIRPRPVPEPIVRFETAPGLQGQVDFAECQFPWGKRYALLVVLGYSRLLWVRFYPQQTLVTLVRGLEEAFAYFGGVPRELLFDQLKAVIVSDRRPDGGRVLENPEFLRFGAHWGFRIRACRPYRAQTKGKVERPIHYLRDNFLYGREFLGDDDLDAQGRHWLDTVANPRVHGTTRERPRVRFERDERALLQPLASRPHQLLVLPAARRRDVVRVRPVPHLTVERRALTAYTQLLTEAR